MHELLVNSRSFLKYLSLSLEGCVNLSEPVLFRLGLGGGGISTNLSMTDECGWTRSFHLTSKPTEAFIRSNVDSWAILFRWDWTSLKSKQRSNLKSHNSSVLAPRWWSSSLLSFRRDSRPHLFRVHLDSVHQSSSRLCSSEFISTLFRVHLDSA